jgi:mRNA-degrading endonuclease toxin of MazEF toxin-antitoxin module
VVVVQADTYNAHLKHYIVAEVTTNLSSASDPTSLLIDVSTPEGQATGLAQNSVIGCLFLATVADHRLGPAIGRLDPSLVQKLNECLKVAMEIT